MISYTKSYDLRAFPPGCNIRTSGSTALAAGVRQLRILLAEDDAVVGSLLAELLVGIGHDVCRIATTENEAVAAAAQEFPDLMIVDAHLRQGSGMAAMETILRSGPMPHIFMTGNSRLTMPSSALVLRKPFSVTDLIAAVNSAAGYCAVP